MAKYGGIFTSRKGYQVVSENGEAEVRYLGTGGTIWRVE
jgi:hypothetical protein